MKRNYLKQSQRNIRYHIETLFGQKSCFWQQKDFQTTLLPQDWILRDKSSANGGSDFSLNVLLVSRSNLGRGVQPLFPPQVVIEVKALACELPYHHGIPLSRFSIEEIRREVIARGIAAHISGATLWRWLNADAIRPWLYRSWIFPHDPAFEEKAARILDLYEGFWNGLPLGPNDYVLSADEKTSIQARIRKHQTRGPLLQRVTKVEHEYQRGGAFTYIAAWDVRRAKIFGHIEKKSGINAFSNLVDQVMSQEPYRTASRVFWIVDNGSSHRGEPAIKRLRKAWPNALMIHLPVHASWLNQIEIYFSVIQRKVLTPNDSLSLADIKDRLLKFQKHYECVATPFEWKFTRKDLANLMHKLSNPLMLMKKAA